MALIVRNGFKIISFVTDYFVMLIITSSYLFIFVIPKNQKRVTIVI
jgi:hypothetical protein